MIHSDVWGPAQTVSALGNRYFVTFIDEYSRYCTVFGLKLKNEVVSAVKHYISIFERQLGLAVKAIRTDNGGEFLGPFQNLLQEKGIRHYRSVPYSSWQKTESLNE
jgi:IS30 family transposase